MSLILCGCVPPIYIVLMVSFANFDLAFGIRLIRAKLRQSNVLKILVMSQDNLLHAK